MTVITIPMINNSVIKRLSKNVLGLGRLLSFRIFSGSGSEANASEGNPSVTRLIHKRLMGLNGTGMLASEEPKTIKISARLVESKY